jgi:hypothetical protein
MSTSATAESNAPSVFVPQRFEPLRALVQSTGAKNAPFKAMYDLLTFGAVLGFNETKTGELATSNSDRISSHSEVKLDNPDRVERTMIDIIAVVAADGDEVLFPGKQQERVDTFMRFACGGLDYILELVAEGRTPRDAIDAILRGAVEKDTSASELRASIAGLANDV